MHTSNYWYYFVFQQEIPTSSDSTVEVHNENEHVQCFADYWMGNERSDCDNPPEFNAELGLAMEKTKESASFNSLWQIII